MSGPIEEHDENSLAPDVSEDEILQDWELAEDLAEIENHRVIQVLQNAVNKNDSSFDAQPQSPPTIELKTHENESQPQTVFLPSEFHPTTNISINIPESTLVTPKYLYQGEDLPASPEREWRVVQSLLEEHQHLSDEHDDFIEFELDHFTIYTDPYAPGSTTDYAKLQYPAELRPLQHLSTKQKCTLMYFDGVLSAGEKRYFVRQVPFGELPIGNYGLSEHTIGSNIWIRSKMSAKIANRGGPDVYYRLKSPSSEYRRYHKGFLWVADLAKHVADYLSAAVEERQSVVLRDFQSHFSEWLFNYHQESEAFKQWRTQLPSADFRCAVVANLEFIFKETNGVLGYDKTTSIHLWKEIRDFTAYPDASKSKGKAPATPSSASDPHSPAPDTASIDKTIVTPYIDQLFSHLPCGPWIEALRPSEKVDRLRTKITSSYKLEPAAHVHTSANQMENGPLDRDIQVGDVISTPRDDDDDSHWVREVAEGFEDVDRWFGLVQKIHQLQNGDQSFDVIWFYRPVDTLCGSMRYPWNNELFLSDHCSCRDGHAKIKASEVLSIHRIHWGGSSSTDAEFFCRQTYLTQTQTHRWITLQPDHLRCCHNTAERNFEYKNGDTLLIRIHESDQYVEPCELLATEDKEENNGFLTLRLLHRRDRLEPNSNAAPNELVYSDDTITLQPSCVHGRCLVRFFVPGEPISSPYDRKGVANAFFITHRLLGGQIVPMTITTTLSLRQGFDPSQLVPKLQGVDLFCGGGNFGRGLEEGGAVKMKWANDINTRAIHTYMANTTDSVHPFVGSIDDLQRLALEGKFSDKVPEIGQVDFVSAGSPCPGFSRLTFDKTNSEQRKNQSLVAAFASFIDTYRPKFGLLENVLEIVQGKGKRKEDVFCQLICAIIGLGYQAHFFLLDAWSHGSPQSRSRVFLCFAAPGLRLPEMPIHSHSHYQSTIRSKTLGRLPNHEPMGQRLFMSTPFKFVSAREATADLPDIMDGKADCCISFPDHRFANGYTKSFRNQLSVIPTQPYNMNFTTSWNKGRGVMTAAERQFFPERGQRVEISSRAWGRSSPNTVMQTITTTPSPADGRIGKVLHWNESRVFTVMEARRAQGFLDHEVLLGEPKDQWKVIGNSVAREVSLVLGLAFREAWLGSLIEADETDPSALSRRQDISGDRPREPDFTQLNTPPRAVSRRSTPTSGTDASRSQGPSRATPAKRPLSSTLEVQMFVSKITKTNRNQTATGERRVEVDATEDLDIHLITSDLPGHSKKRSRSHTHSPSVGLS